jgi:hypothetical protein
MYYVMISNAMLCCVLYCHTICCLLFYLLPLYYTTLISSYLLSILSILKGGYNVRAANHTGLLVALKEVNQMIQRAANLRVGKPKQSVIADCRAAVKTNNMPALTRIIRYGYENCLPGSNSGGNR